MTESELCVQRVSGCLSVLSRPRRAGFHRLPREKTAGRRSWQRLIQFLARKARPRLTAAVSFSYDPESYRKNFEDDAVDNGGGDGGDVKDDDDIDLSLGSPVGL